MPKNINSFTIIITLEGIEEINTEKMTTKHSEEYFSHQRCQPRSQGLSSAHKREWSKKDPGLGWSRVFQILAGYK